MGEVYLNPEGKCFLVQSLLSTFSNRVFQPEVYLSTAVSIFSGLQFFVATAHHFHAALSEATAFCSVTLFIVVWSATLHVEGAYCTLVQLS